MRAFSVTEELLSIDPATFEPAPLKATMVLRYPPEASADVDKAPCMEPDQGFFVELLDQKIRVTGPQQTSMQGQRESISVGRAIADRAARAQDRRAVALGSLGFPIPPVEQVHGVAGVLTTRGSSMCGTEVHVQIESPLEGVEILDRLRVWLPVVLALSTNSPFWQGKSMRYNSHRYFSRSAWPAPGPNNIFGSVERYNRWICRLIHPAAALQPNMTRMDARLSENHRTLDVSLADVCMDTEHSVALATITRALVETMKRQWAGGSQPLPCTIAGLRASTWLAAVGGLDATLISPSTAIRRPAAAVVAELLELIEPVLVENDEAQDIGVAVDDMLEHGTGSRVQRATYALRQDLHDVVDAAMRRTHTPDQSALSKTVQAFFDTNDLDSLALEIPQPVSFAQQR